MSNSIDDSLNGEKKHDILCTVIVHDIFFGYRTFMSGLPRSPPLSSFDLKAFIGLLPTVKFWYDYLLHCSVPFLAPSNCNYFFRRLLLSLFVSPKAIRTRLWICQNFGAFDSVD